MRSGRGVRWWLLFAAVSALVLAASLLLDPSIEAWIRAHQDRGIRSLMRWVSYLGDWVGHAVIGLLIASVALLRRNRRLLRISLAMLLALALAGGVTRVVKIAAGRARPSVDIDAGFNGPRFTAKYHAFPSGHTSGSTAFFGVLAFVNRRVFAALLPIPLLVGFARIYLTAHHFSDVIAGAIIGIAMATWIAHWRKFEIVSDRSRDAT